MNNKEVIEKIRFLQAILASKNAEDREYVFALQKAIEALKNQPDDNNDDEMIDFNKTIELLETAMNCNGIGFDRIVIQRNTISNALKLLKSQRDRIMWLRHKNNE